ncbi:3'-5' exonuclease [Pseudochryseolinea flava]|uniref:3'-5' exonuclease n=1 Tax=Pseudochryseolinea flava TaxID=2059302 RepID=A0A364Y7I4_9BACT|nr:3'-5' exonuclease [Pseudochryseolinea flava]RAW03031.1 3'-5' exonuclease [Pseudochryseolinea flava]
MLSELRDIVFLDIETVANTYDYQNLNERLKTQWSRKANFFRKNELQTDEDIYHERAGIYAEFGKIICIVVGKYFMNEQGQFVLKTKAYYGDDEKALLLDFNNMLEKLDPRSTKLCAHNGKEFDFPYLCRRMLINCVPLPFLLNLSGKKSWEIPHLDTMEMWKFGDYKHFTSLDLLAAIFDVPSSKTDMEGSRVNHAYHVDKELEKIKEYCVRDVLVLAQLYLKLKCISLPNEFIAQQS